MPAAPAPEKRPVPMPEKGPVPMPEPESSISPRAKLIVELPPDAKLFVDDQPTKTISGRRTFNTPPLQQDQQYYYTLRAEVAREGRTYTESRRVLLRAGQEVRTFFPELEAQIATAPR
jgi:uncharacterized protein (TIGR03000 family)